MGLLTVEPPSDEAVLSVTVTESTDDRIRQWQQHTNSAPAAATAVQVDASTRSVSQPATDESRSCETISRRTVASPSDLTGLGIEIINAIDEFADADEDWQPVVCFHSLTPLLQYVSSEELFQFLHKVTYTFARKDAIAHFHMDPSVHDEQTIGTFFHLFDSVIRYDDEWEIINR
uniref:DUF7504 family protein n=1 Tax=Halomicrobium urmianum TaxID=1586233 RepID=UPI001CDA3608|nr:hypothetical protein [Halomicrobium urmianum]